MEYYKILSLAVSGKKGKVRRAKEVLREDEFEVGTIEGYLKGGHIEKASKKDVSAHLKSIGQDADTLKKNKEAADAAHKAATVKLDAVKAAYSKLSGISVDDINGTWGEPKLNQEIAELENQKSELLSNLSELKGQTVESYEGSVAELKKEVESLINK